MDIFQQISLSVRSYGLALKFIDKHKMWKLFIIPALTSLMVACFVSWFAWHTSEVLTRFAIVKFDIGGDYKYFSSFLEVFTLFFIKGIIFLLYFKLYRYILLFILAPEFSYIISLMQCKAEDLYYCFHIKRYFNDVLRGMKVILRCFILEIFITFLIIVLGIIVTWVLPLLPILIITLEGYFIGYVLADFRNEYKNMNMKESKYFINDNKGLIISNGIFFNFSLLIPIFGVFFAPTFSLIALGLSLNEIEHQNEYYVHSINQSV